MQAMNASFFERLLRDQSLSAVAAGFVTVLVGFASSAAIVFQAAQALGASPAQTASWMWALGIGMGLTCIGLSLRWKVPVVTAWSTPGAAKPTPTLRSATCRSRRRPRSTAALHRGVGRTMSIAAFPC